MNFALIGYPKTGKTTLFNLLTGAKIDVKSFENGKKELNRRTCPVPDPRLDKIWSLYPEKKIYQPLLISSTLPESPTVTLKAALTLIIFAGLMGSPMW